MNTKRIVAFALAGSIGGGLRAQAPSGRITGALSDPAGKALPNAIVTYTREYPKQGDPSPARGVAATGSAGEFSFTGLMAGRYLLCGVASPELELVPNCDWTYAPPAVTLTNGQAASGVKIVLEKGSRVEVRLDDAGGLLPHPVDGGGSGKVHVGLRGSDGMMHTPQIHSLDRGGHTYSAIVPHGRPVAVHVIGQGLRVSDDKGAEVSNRGPGAAFQTAPGDGPRQIRLRVDK